MTNFKTQIELIEKNQIKFINPNNFENNFSLNKNKRKILLTIDDSFLSFYKVAWPFLKKNKIPFILFVNTKEVGSFNYMNWQQIKEIAKEEFVHIGNHSHSHEYLVDKSPNEIVNDIKKSISILKDKTGYSTKFFSYPFGEYSLAFKKIVSELGFKYAFGQHSGVITKDIDSLELPRFPINEKYGETERFKLIIKTLPLKFKKIFPEERYIAKKNNPPEVIIEFDEEVKSLKRISCYSNEENKWRQSEIIFLNKNKLKIDLKGKFTTERGRINCSLRENDGSWRWLGIQFVIAEY